MNEGRLCGREIGIFVEITIKFNPSTTSGSYNDRKTLDNIPNLEPPLKWSIVRSYSLLYYMIRP